MSTVPPELVDAAIRAARQRHQSVAETPIAAVAEEAGVSRRTLLRRLGGTRAALDAALEERGIDPGRKPTVRERAISAAAKLISAQGLGTVTLDAVAEAAECSVPGLHAVFGGRDGLLIAVFDQFGPLREIEKLAETLPEDIEGRVLALYRVLIEAFGREPRVLPALFADLLARPDGPASRMLKERMPRLLHGLGTLLASRVGKSSEVPVPLLIQLLAGPMILHLLMRPTLSDAMDGELPTLQEAAVSFANALLHGLQPRGAD